MALKFDNIKSLFIVDDEDDKKQTKEVKKETKKDGNKTVKEKEESKISWKSTSGTVKQTNSESGEIKGEFNDKIFNSLTKAIANSNLPGEDYLEYMQAFKAMKDIPIEENVKIQTVLATLSTKGLTVAKISESADYYISILENKKRKFYTAFEGQAQGAVTKKKNKIEDLKKQNKEKANLIKQLTDEINKNQDEIGKITLDVQNSQSKIKKTEQNFLVTYDRIKNQIVANVEKVKNIITK